MNKKILSFIFIISLVVTMSVPVFAIETSTMNTYESVDVSNAINYTTTNEPIVIDDEIIIGESDTVHKDTNIEGNVIGIPSVVAFSWNATAYNIKPKVLNSSKYSAIVTTQVKIGTKSKTATFTVKGGDTVTKNIRWDLKTAYKQNINVHFTIKVGTRTINKDMPGSRKLDSYLINSWTKGGRKSKENAIDYHFEKHGSEVSCSSNIKDYTKKAYTYRSKCKAGKGRDISNSLGPRYKFYFTSPSRYIMLTRNGPTGSIISFGS